MAGTPRLRKLSLHEGARCLQQSLRGPGKKEGTGQGQSGQSSPTLAHTGHGSTALRDGANSHGDLPFPYRGSKVGHKRPLDAQPLAQHYHRLTEAQHKALRT